MPASGVKSGSSPKPTIRLSRVLPAVSRASCGACRRSRVVVPRSARPGRFAGGNAVAKRSRIRAAGRRPPDSGVRTSFGERLRWHSRRSLPRTRLSALESDVSHRSHPGDAGARRLPLRGGRRERGSAALRVDCRTFGAARLDPSREAGCAPRSGALRP
jgi:hypothetical protein